MDNLSRLGVSAPFIIQIVNEAGQPAVANVDIGEAIRNRTATNFGQDSHLTITSTISGVSYLDFLAETESRPFTVGAIMVISTSAGQLEQSIGVRHKNISGDDQTHVLTPTLTLNQRQTDRIADDYNFLWDGATRLRINQVNANATLTIKVYPKDIYSASQILAGRNSIDNYRMPNIYG